MYVLVVAGAGWANPGRQTQLSITVRSKSFDNQAHETAVKTESNSSSSGSLTTRRPQLPACPSSFIISSRNFTSQEQITDFLDKKWSALNDIKGLRARTRQSLRRGHHAIHGGSFMKRWARTLRTGRSTLGSHDWRARSARLV